MNVSMYINMYVCVCTYVYIFELFVPRGDVAENNSVICVDKCMNIYVYICIHIYVQTLVNVYINVNLYNTYICIYLHIYT